MILGLVHSDNKIDYDVLKSMRGSDFEIDTIGSLAIAELTRLVEEDDTFIGKYIEEGVFENLLSEIRKCSKTKAFWILNFFNTLFLLYESREDITQNLASLKLTSTLFSIIKNDDLKSDKYQILIHQLYRYVFKKDVPSLMAYVDYQLYIPLSNILSSNDLNVKKSALRIFYDILIACDKIEDTQDGKYDGKKMLNDIELPSILEQLIERDQGMIDEELKTMVDSLNKILMI